MERKKILVLSTAAAAIFFLIIGAVYHFSKEPDTVVLETIGFPSFGNRAAKIEVVIIEDFRCCNCKEFTERVFPQIEARYIESGQVRFTIVPVAFIAGSKPIANAALDVYCNSPERFFAYVKEILPRCQSNEIPSSTLLQIAKMVGGIDLAQLENCMQTNCHYWELEKNLQWAQAVMGKDFGTPALYVNGKPTSTRSFEAVQSRIDQILNEVQ